MVLDATPETLERWWRGVGEPPERVRRALEGVVSVYAEEAPLLRIATEVSTGPSAYAACTIAPNFPSAFGGGRIPEVLPDP